MIKYKQINILKIDSDTECLGDDITLRGKKKKFELLRVFIIFLKICTNELTYILYIASSKKVKIMKKTKKNKKLHMY